ncbi:hypothetical protein [Citreimonas salinaria]|uniref:Predicted 5' DNA nuclease, flap endonuclease-1-like, helix-3-turn-helix (H3TH) domain n=1 Tax=Citreimonas salinaria TaxID=321339 RepID=A0A1H3GW77_9RHOB|nr:hypothetical protein [Citreimonas salinaria]SDY07576.1 Predicted 5' DNA nuclease, flap endonuclease-1-like, helix-3-turn-helix (H3TH) domain [Citreimonas salinaria]
MSDDRDGFSCKAGCWALAVAGGALVFVLLLVPGGWGFFGALFLAALVMLGLGGLAQYAFCGTMGGRMTMPPAPRADATDRPAQERDPTAPRPIEAMVPAGAAAVTPATAQAATTPPADPAAESEPVPADDARPAAEAPREPAKPIPPRDPVPAGAPGPGAASEPVGRKPETLDAPRGAGGDDLQRIKGVGPKLAGQLNAAGIYHFDQIAGWSADEVAWIERNVDGAKGRIIRDDWVAQARTLATG